MTVIDLFVEQNRHQHTVNTTGQVQQNRHQHTFNTSGQVQQNRHQHTFNTSSVKKLELSKQFLPLPPRRTREDKMLDDLAD